MDIKEVNQSLDPYEVLSSIGYEGSQPTQSGPEIRDFCPIHGGDRQKSLAINISTKTFKCHSCDAHGDLVGLYAQAKGMLDIEAAKQLDQGFTPSTTYVTSNVKKTNTNNTKNYTDQDVIACWDNAAEAGEDTYFKFKGLVPPPLVRFGKNPNGFHATMAQFTDINGSFRGFASLNYENHSKFNYLANEEELPRFTLLGTLDGQSQIYIGEGIATVQTPWEATDRRIPGVSAGTWSNILPVLKSIKQKYPQIKPIMLIDLDDQSSGLKAARQVREVYPDAVFRMPNFDGLPNKDNTKPKDFNDLVSVCGQTLSVVNDQLKKEFMLPLEIIPAQKEQLIPEALAPKITPSSFNIEFQEEVLSYLFKQSFDGIIQDGFSPESIEPHLFTGHRRLAIDAIIRAWEQEQPISISQLSINSNNDAPEFYEFLKNIEAKPRITVKQVADRIEKLNQQHAQNQFTALMAEVQESSLSLDQKTDNLRKGMDSIHENTSIIFPQTNFLPQILEDLKNPKLKPLPTGIKSFDRLLGGGFKKTELGVLAGGAGAGKTAFALQIADSVAQNGGVVLYISVEIGVNKLTERSLKRLRYSKDKIKSLDEGVDEYQKFAGNIYLIKGRHGMLVSEIRRKVLSVMRQRKGSDILLIIDPFQRLGSGNEKVDSSNETIKVSTLSSQIKEMAENLNIPILALSDTVKAHKDNASGEGSIRGSYMADHTADYVMMLRTSRNVLKALYGGTKDIKDKEEEQEDPFFAKIKAKLDNDYRFKPDGEFALKSDYDKYTSLVTSKVRDSGKFSPLFTYRPAFHLFEDLPIWDDILPSEKY